MSGRVIATVLRAVDLAGIARPPRSCGASREGAALALRRPGSVCFIGRPSRGLPPLTHDADADVTITAYLLVRVRGTADAAQRDRQEQDRRGAGYRKRNR